MQMPNLIVTIRRSAGRAFRLYFEPLTRLARYREWPAFDFLRELHDLINLVAELRGGGAETARVVIALTRADEALASDLSTALGLNTLAALINEQSGTRDGSKDERAISITEHASYAAGYLAAVLRHGKPLQHISSMDALYACQFEILQLVHRLRPTLVRKHVA